MNQAKGKDIRLGIFDSGLGGLSVYKEILKILPEIQTFYISDLAFCPYGEKSQEQIIQRCLHLTETLLAQKVDLVVVACNTATAQAIDQLRKYYASHSVPFVGVEPYLNFVNHYQGEEKIKPAVLLTKASAISTRFEKLRLKFNLQGEELMAVYPCEGLAALIENHLVFKSEPYFQDEFKRLLRPLKGQGYTHLILGCTHYPILKKEIEEYLQLKCVAPEASVASHISYLLNSPNFLDINESDLPFKLPLTFQNITDNLFLSVTKEDRNLQGKIDYILNLVT